MLFLSPVGPYHPHEPCSKQLASDGEALEGQVSALLLLVTLCVVIVLGDLL